MADGGILRWISNLKRFNSFLGEYDNYFIGHGPTCTHEDLNNQRRYLEIYCAELLNAAGNSEILDDETKSIFESRMIELFPLYGCQFMVGLSANAVFSEIRNK